MVYHGVLAPAWHHAAVFLTWGGLPPYDDAEGEALQLGAASRGSAREFFESCRATATRVPGVSVLHGSGA